MFASNIRQVFANDTMHLNWLGQFALSTCLRPSLVIKNLKFGSKYELSPWPTAPLGPGWPLRSPWGGSPKYLAELRGPNHNHNQKMPMASLSASDYLGRLASEGIMEHDWTQLSSWIPALCTLHIFLPLAFYAWANSTSIRVKIVKHKQSWY